MSEKSHNHCGMKNAWLIGLHRIWHQAAESATHLSSNSVFTVKKNDNDILERLIALDNGGRRSGGDRRCYSYTLHIPERRSGKDRRSGDDRRKISRSKIKPRNWFNILPCSEINFKIEKLAYNIHSGTQRKYQLTTAPILSTRNFVATIFFKTIAIAAGHWESLNGK